MASKQLAQEYQSYLIRFRRIKEEPLVWHISVQDVRTGEWHHFTDMARLFEFVNQELAINAAPSLDE